MAIDQSTRFPIKVISTPDRGRAVVSTEHIPSGAVAFIGVPYASSISVEERSKVCSACFRYAGGRKKWEKRTLKRGGLENPGPPAETKSGIDAEHVNDGRRYCSDKCRDFIMQLDAYGIEAKWLEGLEEEVWRRKRRAGRKAMDKSQREIEARKIKGKKRSKSPSSQAFDETEDLGLEVGLGVGSDERDQTVIDPPRSQQSSTTRSPQGLESSLADSDEVVSSWLQLWDLEDGQADALSSKRLEEELKHDNYVPDDFDLDIARLIVSVLARKWTEAAANGETEEPNAGNELLDGTSNHLVDIDVARLPVFADMLCMQFNEQVYLLNVARRERCTKPFPLPEALFRYLNIYRLLRSVEQGALQARGKRPSKDTSSTLKNSRRALGSAFLPPVLGQTSHLFRSVAFREIANSFGIWEPGPSDPSAAGYSARELMGFAIFPLASFFNHDCQPNLKRNELHFPDEPVGAPGVSEFRAERDIGPGEELTIGYGDLSEGVQERRQRLLDNYFFKCMCTRCTKEDNVQHCSTNTTV